jgi:uncharacterized SAM-binding protein YcdF (DUF218 family)
LLLFTALLIFTVAGTLWPRVGARRLLVKVAALMLFLLCWTPVSMLIVRAVQSPYSWQPPTDKQAGAIVVLAGEVHDPFPPLPLPLLGSSTYERCRYAAWLYHEWEPLPLLLSGGSLHSDQRWSYAEVMRDFLLRHGVPESKLIIENRSRSTDENARYTAEILRQKAIRKIVLVTDAVHMRRAQKTFEKLGFMVIPAPCGFRPVYEFDWGDALPSWRAIVWNEDVLHEVVGLIWYWARGRI